MEIPPLWYRIFYAPASPAGPIARSEALELFDYYRTGAPNTLYEALSCEIYRAALNSDTAAFVHLAAWLDAVYDHFADAPAVQAAWALARGEIPDFPLQNIRERHGRPALWLATFGAFENAVVASPETVRALIRAGADPLESFVVPGE